MRCLEGCGVVVEEGRVGVEGDDCMGGEGG